MTPLLAIDCKSLRVRRYVRRELGLGVTRLEASHESVIQPPIVDTERLCAELEAFRAPPARRHVNVPEGSTSA